MDRMQKNAGFTVGLVVFYCGFQGHEQGWFMIIWVKYRTTVTIHVGHYPKMTQHFRLVRCFKTYPGTMGKSSFEDLVGKVILGNFSRRFCGVGWTDQRKPNCELRRVAASPSGCVWKWLVPHCTQWFCWSLSLWKMAISLGILTLFSDKPIWPEMDRDGPNWGGSFCRHMDELATLIECCRRDTSHCFTAFLKHQLWNIKFHSEFNSDFIRLIIPSGELTVCNGKSPFLMGKSTISMAIFNCKLLVHQRVIQFLITLTLISQWFSPNLWKCQQKQVLSSEGHHSLRRGKRCKRRAWKPMLFRAPSGPGFFSRTWPKLDLRISGKPDQHTVYPVPGPVAPPPMVWSPNVLVPD